MSTAVRIIFFNFCYSLVLAFFYVFSFLVHLLNQLDLLMIPYRKIIFISNIHSTITNSIFMWTQAGIGCHGIGMMESDNESCTGSTRLHISSGLLACICLMPQAI